MYRNLKSNYTCIEKSTIYCFKETFDWEREMQPLAQTPSVTAELAAVLCLELGVVSGVLVIPSFSL